MSFTSRRQLIIKKLFYKGSIHFTSLLEVMIHSHPPILSRNRQGFVDSDDDDEDEKEDEKQSEKEVCLLYTNFLDSMTFDPSIR